MRQARNARGYSLVELLVVVAMVGIILLVTMPALLQLMPQYRIRSAASETANNLRMIRQRAISTRTPWRVSFDFNNNRYRYYMLKEPNLELKTADNWKAISKNGLTADLSDSAWVQNPQVDLAVTPNPFNDVVCPTDATPIQDVIFLRDGSISDQGPCSNPSTKLTFTTSPSVVFSVDSNFVKYNRYYISLDQSGYLKVRPLKQ